MGFSGAAISAPLGCRGLPRGALGGGGKARRAEAERWRWAGAGRRAGGAKVRCVATEKHDETAAASVGVEFADEEDYRKGGGGELLYVQMQATKTMESQSKIASKLLPISENSILDLVVIGCGPAGLSLAAESAKKGLSVGLIGPDLPFTNNYGVWEDEFKDLGLESCIEHVWKDTIVYLDNNKPILIGRSYGRVHRDLLHEELLRRCYEAGVTYLNSKVDKIIESPDGHRVVCCERGREILCRLAIVASGAASGRLLEYEVGGPRVCVQTAYGVEVEETCLASKDAMPFDVLKKRLMYRLDVMGVRILKVHEEEWSYIPVGGSLPNTDQKNLAFGAAASMVHPATEGWRQGREEERQQEERRNNPPPSTSLPSFFSRAPSSHTFRLTTPLIGQSPASISAVFVGTMQGGPLSPDEYRAASPPALLHQPASTIVVAIDRDRNSQLAVKWVVDHLLSSASHIVLLHVAAHYPANHGFAVAETTQGALEAEMKEIFVPYRGFFNRNAEADVSKAILGYITANKIQSIALGGACRNAFTKKFKNADVPSTLMKCAPDYCNIYVVAKGKSVNVRLAKCGVPNAGADISPDTDSLRGASLYMRRGSRGYLPPATPPDTSRRSVDSRSTTTLPELTTRPPFRERSLPSSATKNVMIPAAKDYSDVSSSRSQAQREVEVEMRRLRLELKQTMDMYNAACKEALNAKQRAKEMQLLKLEEARRLEEARHAEEAALALAEMEKAKCRAAMEAAEAAQRLADLEAQRRRNAEVRARREADEKVRALDAISSHDFRYRKYHIDEIETATERFSDELKIGEGGYGPVYRASLDHTPVAIKVLRPDAHQGRKQFQQEVEVLSCIRHPNMVLLLGACPEYGCLVYEYMENGSLEDRLFRRGGTAPIPWPHRFRIAAEIATSLLFLHQAKPEPLVHRDLKPANILLDRNFVSKISDVGLARLVPPAVADSVTQYRLTATAGTFCYIDPEYQQTGKLGVKSDIYSLGVLLLQVVTARPPRGLTHHVEKAIDAGTFHQMLDITVKDWPVEEALGYAKLALKCTELRRRDRPDLATVILPELNRLRNVGIAYEAARMAAGTSCGGGGGDGGVQISVSSPTYTSWFSAPSIVPVRCDDSLLRNFPISSAPLQVLLGMDPLEDLIGLEITIPSSLINRIKVEFSKRFTGEPCTKFEVASAVLWQCRTRAIMCNPETPALFSYAVNIRKHVGAKQGYYGNCLAGQLVVATSGIVASGDIVDLVKMIKQSKEKIADQFKKIDEDSNQQAVGPQMEQLAQLRYSILIVSSWGNLGFDEVDFGSGGPDRVTPYGNYKSPFPLCAMCLPFKAKDGVNMLGAVVKEEHAGAFLGEIERFTK
nr:unnamed protein product [Digitaria exilis]